MATTSADKTSADTSRRISLGGSTRPRRPVHPARKRMAIAVVLVIVGSFLPWFFAGGVGVAGSRGPGLWTFYASMLGLAAALMPWHRVGAVHGAIMAATAIALPVWQLVHLISLVGFSGWLPGPGMVMVLFGGILAAGGAVQLYRHAVPAPERATS